MLAVTDRSVYDSDDVPDPGIENGDKNDRVSLTPDEWVQINNPYESYFGTAVAMFFGNRGRCANGRFTMYSRFAPILPRLPSYFLKV